MSPMVADLLFLYGAGVLLIALVYRWEAWRPVSEYEIWMRGYRMPATSTLLFDIFLWPVSLCQVLFCFVIWLVSRIPVCCFGIDDPFCDSPLQTIQTIAICQYRSIRLLLNKWKWCAYQDASMDY